MASLAPAAAAARAAGCEERSGFPSNDVEVHLFRDVEPAGLLDLEQLAFAHFPHRSRGDLEQVVGLRIDSGQQASRQEVVPDEHRHFFLPERLNAEHAAPQWALVNHVIVDQGGGVQEFNQGCGRVGAVGGGSLGVDSAVQACAEKHKHGPHLLALASEDVPHDRVEQRDVGGDGRPKFGLEGRHVPFEKGSHTFQIRHGGKGSAGLWGTDV